MRVDPRTPCIIGVAARTWHPVDVGAEGAPEPLAMWEEVARAAAADASPRSLLEQLDSIQIVYCQTWQYDDAVARLAERLGADPQHRSLFRHRRHDHAAARQRDRGAHARG